MGIFDKNIHMNGSGTTYQAFLDLADAAEREGGTGTSPRRRSATGRIPSPSPHGPSAP